MVRGRRKRCWEIHPLTSYSPSVITHLSFLLISMVLWLNGTKRCIAGMEKMWVCFLSTSRSSQRAQNRLHNRPAYFKALMQYCFSVFCWCLLPLSPIFCLIVIHVLSVCLANLLVLRPSQLSYFVSMCHWVYFVLSFVLFASPWWFMLSSEMLQDFPTSSRLSLLLRVSECTND